MPSPLPILLLGAGAIGLVLAAGKKDAKASPSLPGPGDAPPGPPVDAGGIEAELARMTPAARKAIRELLSNSTDVNALISAAAQTKANGFPLVSAALANRAKQLQSVVKTPPGFSTQPVIVPRAPKGPETIQSELARMSAKARAAIVKLLRTGTDPNVLMSAAAQTQKQGFPLVSEALVKRAQRFTALPVATPTMSSQLQKQLAEALQRLNTQPNGTVRPPIGPADIQFATLVAGRLEKGRFFDTAKKLRALVKQASKLVADPPTEKQLPLPDVPVELVKAINRALQLERDPAKLRVLLRALKKLPKSSERNVLISALEALIASIEAKNDTDDTTDKIDDIIKSPKPPPSPKPQPPVTSPGLPPIVVPVPDAPKPQPIPEPDSPEGRIAKALAAHLNKLQARLGMPRAKGDQDFTLVKKFQRAINGKPDGMPGPSTFMAMARLGVSTLPQVMYWPKTSTLANLEDYLQSLLTLADAAERVGQVQRAANLRASAAREKGAGGLIKVTKRLRQSPVGVARAGEIASMKPHQLSALHKGLASNSRSTLTRVANLMAKAGFPNTAKELAAQAAKTRVS